jgi:Flp pilus assembly protein TadD/Mg-chelatase subunit ChlD
VLTTESLSTRVRASLSRLSLVIISLLAVCGGFTVACADPPPLRHTTADLQPIHVGVTSGGTQVRQVERVAPGDRVSTDGTGRARLRIDDGTSLVLDRATTLLLEPSGVVLETGRLFVTSPAGVHTRIGVAGASVAMSGASAALSLTEGAESASVFSVDGDLTVLATLPEQTEATEHAVRSGETAHIGLNSGAVEIKPERAFDDWTEGLAVPWGANHGTPRRAVGELWGRTPEDPAGAPMTIRAHDVKTTIRGEVAVTVVRTTYFNGGNAPVASDFRMALPVGAIVSRFAFGSGDELTRTRVSLASRAGGSGSGTQLEWAGDGWVRGRLPQIAPGTTLTVELEFTEWLDVTPRDNDRVSVRYRYPLVPPAAPGRATATASAGTSAGHSIGEFAATIDASPSAPLSLAAGMGATTEGQTVSLRHSDWSPSADLVVDAEFAAWKSPARLYVASATGDDADAGRYVMVRTEIPDASTDVGVSVVLVLDASASVNASMLETSRSFVRAVLRGLDARDRAVVLAADQTTHPVGPADMGPLTDARKQAMLAGLDTLSPGGATDIGRALEAGADLVPAESPETMLVYIGDGWSTVGDASLNEIEARLIRRRGRLPRLGAVSIGPTANRRLLAGLVHGSGPLLSASDSAEAASAAIDLVSSALQPTLTNVGIDLGPDVEQVYPRRTSAVAAGSTLTVLARARGVLPKKARLYWRDAQGEQSEVRDLTPVANATEGDLRRRWAQARVREILLSGGGREAVTDVALATALLTPWTAFTTGGSTYDSTPRVLRVLDDSVFANFGDGSISATQTPLTSAMRGALLQPTTQYRSEAEVELSSAAALAIRRKLRNALPAVRACRDSRASAGSLLAESVSISLGVDGRGKPSNIRVGGRGVSTSLSRCIRIVVSGLVYPTTGLSVRVDVSEELALPAFRTKRGGNKCSTTSRLPIALRRGVWKQRLGSERNLSAQRPHELAQWAESAADVYFGAKHRCEVRKWRDRRALLEIILLHESAGQARFAVANRLSKEGEDNAAEFLRKEAIRRAASPDELRALLNIVTASERLPRKSFEKDYRAARSNAHRLRVVQRYLLVAPHSALLRGRLIALFESLGQKEQVLQEVRLVRSDPFADAALLADSGSALRRVGYEAEARRVFGELTERAPSDPWVRAFLGDRLRNEGWFNDATATYAVLDQQVPDSPSVIVRHALSHAGAGRLDLARRMLTRVAQTGGREADGNVAALASQLSAVLLAEAIADPTTSPADRALLRQAAEQTPGPQQGPKQGASILVRAPAAYAALTIELVRGKGASKDVRSPKVVAPGMGLYLFSLTAAQLKDAKLRIRQPEQLPPANPIEVRIDTLVYNGEELAPHLHSTTASLPSSGRNVDVAWANAP